MDELHEELKHLKAKEKEYQDIFKNTRGRLNASVGHFMGQALLGVQRRITEIEKKLNNPN